MYTRLTYIKYAINELEKLKSEQLKNYACKPQFKDFHVQLFQQARFYGHFE